MGPNFRPYCLCQGQKELRRKYFFILFICSSYNHWTSEMVKQLWHTIFIVLMHSPNCHRLIYMYACAEMSSICCHGPKSLWPNCPVLISWLCHYHKHLDAMICPSLSWKKLRFNLYLIIEASKCFPRLVWFSNANGYWCFFSRKYQISLLYSLPIGFYSKP